MYEYTKILLIPVDRSECTSSNITNQIIRKIKPSHKPHASKAISI